MNKLFTNIKTSFKKTKFKIKSKSALITVVAGVGAMGAATVIGIVQTYRLPKVLEAKNKEVEDIMNNDHISDEDEKEALTEQEKEEAASKVVIRTWLKVAGMYIPVAALSIGGAFSIFTSYRIMSKRNAALTAAYLALNESYKQYRKRVEEELGTEEERKIRYDAQEESEEGKKVQLTEDGRVMTVLEKLGYSPYARIFDKDHPGWSYTHRENVVLIRQAYETARRLLERDGHLFLNEVYRMLGEPETEAGNNVGWIKSSRPEKQIGDDYISFGIDPCHLPYQGEDGTDAWILDFNVVDISNVVFGTKY